MLETPDCKKELEKLRRVMRVGLEAFRGGFEKGEGLVGVDWDKADEGAGAGDSGTVQDDVAGGRLYNGYFESGHGFFLPRAAAIERRKAGEHEEKL